MTDQGDGAEGKGERHESGIEDGPVGDHLTKPKAEDRDFRTEKLAAVDAATQPSREMPRMANSLSDRLRRRLASGDDETRKTFDVVKSNADPQDETHQELDVRAVLGDEGGYDEEATHKHLDVTGTLASEDEQPTNKRLNVAQTLGSVEDPTHRTLDVAGVLSEAEAPTNKQFDPSDAIAARDEERTSKQVDVSAIRDTSDESTHRQLDVSGLRHSEDAETTPYATVSEDDGTTRHQRVSDLDRGRLFAEEVIQVTKASGRHAIVGKSAESRLDNAIHRVHLGRHGGSDDKTHGLVIVESDLFAPLPEDVYGEDYEAEDSTIFFAEEILADPQFQTGPNAAVEGEDGDLEPEERLDLAIRKLHVSRHGGTDEGTLRLTAVQPEDVLDPAELAQPLKMRVAVGGTFAASLLIMLASAATAINLWWDLDDLLVCYFATWGIPVAIGWLVLERKNPLRAIPPLLVAVAVSLPLIAWGSDDVRISLLELLAPDLGEGHARRVLLDPSDDVALKVCELVGGAGRLDKLVAADLAVAPTFALRCLERIEGEDQRDDLAALVSGTWRATILAAPSCDEAAETIAAYASMADVGDPEGVRKLTTLALEAGAAEVRECLAREVATRTDAAVVAALGDPELRTVYDESLFRLGIRFAFAPAGDVVAKELQAHDDTFRVWLVRLGCRLTLDIPDEFEVVSDLNSVGSAMAGTDGMGASRSTWLGWCGQLGPETTAAAVIQMVHGVRVDEAMRLARTAVLRARHAYSRRGTPEAIREGSRLAASEGHQLFGSGVLTKRPDGELVHPGLHEMVWQFDSEVQVHAGGTDELWGSMKGQPTDESQLLCERGRDSLLGGARFDFVRRYSEVNPEAAGDLAADARAKRESLGEEERATMRKAIENDCGEDYLVAVDEEVAALDALAPPPPDGEEESKPAKPPKKKSKRGRKR